MCVMADIVYPWLREFVGGEMLKVGINNEGVYCLVKYAIMCKHFFNNTEKKTCYSYKGMHYNYSGFALDLYAYTYLYLFPEP